MAWNQASTGGQIFGTPVDPASPGGSLVHLQEETTRISGLTEDLTPDGATDFLMTSDASEGGEHKKVLINSIPGLGTVTELFIPLRNESGFVIAKGKLLYAAGFSGGRVTVDLADKDDPAKRPAIAVTTAAISNNSDFDGLVSGLLQGVDTSTFSLTDQLVLGDGGNFSRPPPDQDPFTGEVQAVGSTARIDAVNGIIQVEVAQGLDTITADESFAVTSVMGRGKQSGGAMSRATGRDLDVALGIGFVTDGTEYRRVLWSADTITLAANQTSFVFVDSIGTVSTSTSLPNLDINILLGSARTDASSIVFLSEHTVALSARNAGIHRLINEIIGPSTVSGGLATINGTNALRLDVDAATFYITENRRTTPTTAPITFTHWYRDGSGGHKFVTSETIVDVNNFDDGSGTLAALTAGKFKKDLVYIAVNNGVVEYHVVYGQEEFSTQSEAEAGDRPIPSEDLRLFALRSSGVVILKGAAAITSIVDERPFLGQLSTGMTAASDHGLLAGLGDDDHPQYQTRSEKNTANGYAGIGAGSQLADAQVAESNVTQHEAAFDIGNQAGTLADDAAHGARGGGAQHADVVAAGASGFMAGTDKTKLNGIEALADVTDTANVTTAMTDGAHGVRGGGTLHADVVAAGASGFMTGGDKTKLDGIEALADVTDEANVTAAMTDSAHGVRGGGTQHAEATQSLAGFMSSSDKAKLDSLANAEGLDVKESVRVATTAAGTLATDFENGDTVDGIVLATGDRILIKNQASGIENGIYDVQASGAPIRSADMGVGAEAASNFTFVEEGTTNVDAGFVCTTDQPNDIVGTDALAFSQFSGAGSITAGDGLTKTGNTLNVIANADGSIVSNADDVQVGVLATDAQHGTRGGGTQHANVIAAGAAGFMTGTDKTKLNGIEALADVTDTANVTTAMTDGAHGTRGGGTLHANVVAAGAAGFMTGADKTKLNGLGPPSSALIGATGDITTTSTTDVIATSMIETPVAGTYMVEFSGSVDHGTNGATIELSIHVDGAQQASSERRFMRGNQNISSPFSCKARVTVNGTEQIEGRWRVSSGTGTMHERTLDRIEVS